MSQKITACALILYPEEFEILQRESQKVGMNIPQFIHALVDDFITDIKFDNIGEYDELD